MNPTLKESINLFLYGKDELHKKEAIYEIIFLLRSKSLSSVEFNCKISEIYKALITQREKTEVAINDLDYLREITNNFIDLYTIIEEKETKK